MRFGCWRREPDGTFARIHLPWSLENFEDGLIRSGRFRVYYPDHNRAAKDGYILRSIVAYENYHETEVPQEMVVHHIDNDPLNDSKSNLMLMPRSGQGSHSAHHGRGKNGNRNNRWKGDNVKPDAIYRRALKTMRQAIQERRVTPEIEAEYERAKIGARPEAAKRMREFGRRKSK